MRERNIIPSQHAKKASAPLSDYGYIDIGGKQCLILIELAPGARGQEPVEAWEDASQEKEQVPKNAGAKSNLTPHN